MSFGFPKVSRAISEAILDVNKTRNNSVVFLASAGNDVDKAESYPACDPSVIATYGCKSTGTFLDTNPIPSGAVDSRKLVGTYGDNIPSALVEELRTSFKDADFSPGTSIATAVAAGIVGLILSYAAAMPHLLHVDGAEMIYNELKTTEGMRHMLFDMGKSRDGLQHFVNPMRYWVYRSNDFKMFRGMCAALPQKETG